MSETSSKIEWCRDDDGHLRLGPLSDAQRRLLFTELGPMGGEMEDVVLSGIERTLHNFVAQSEFMNRRGSRSEELKRATRARNALAELISALDDLGPEATEDMLDVVTDDRGQDFEVFCTTAKEWAAEFDEFVRSYEVPRGRRALEEYDEAVIDLACLYETATGRAAAVPSRYVSAPSSSAQDIHGPFARFCVAVLRIVQQSEHSTILNSVRRVVEHRN